LKSDQDIGKHSRWSLVIGTTEDRFYCIHLSDVITVMVNNM